MNISILKAEYQGDYKIKLLFSNNKENIIDFENFLRNAKNPMTRKYLDENLFSNYSIKFGDLIWNDYEMCFPIWDLYINKFNKVTREEFEQILAEVPDVEPPEYDKL